MPGSMRGTASRLFSEMKKVGKFQHEGAVVRCRSSPRRHFFIVDKEQVTPGRVDEIHKKVGDDNVFVAVPLHKRFREELGREGVEDP